MQERGSFFVGTETGTYGFPPEQDGLSLAGIGATALIEALTDATCLVSSDGRIVHANRVAEDLFGYPHRELEGKTLKTLLPDALQTAQIDSGAQHMRIDVPGFSDTRNGSVARRRDGTQFSADVRFSSVASSESLLLLVTIREASGRQKLKNKPGKTVSHPQQVQKTAGFAQGVEELLNAVGDGIVIYDRDMHVLQANAAACMLLEIDLEHAISRQSPSTRRRRMTRSTLESINSRLLSVQPALMRVVREGVTLTDADALDIRVGGQDERTHIVHITAVPLRSADGMIRGGACLLSDVTARRPREDDATERAAQLEATIEAMADGVVLIDPEERLLHINTAARRMLQLDLGADVKGVLPLEGRDSGLDLRDEDDVPLAPSQWPTHRVVMGETLAGAASVDVRVRGLDGRWIDVNAEGAPLRDAMGSVIGGVVVFREVTSRRDQERQTQRTLEDLIEMARALANIGMDTQFDASEPTDNSLRDVPQAPPLGVAHYLARLARDLLRCRTLTIVGLAPGSDLVVPIAADGITVNEESTWSARVAGSTLSAQLGETFVARLRMGEVLVLDAAPHAQREWPYAGNAGVVLVAPLRIGTALAGALTVEYAQEPRAFAMEDLTLVGTVAELVVRILERERLVVEARARADAESHLQMLQTILDELPCAVYLVRGPEARLVLANQASQSLFGVTPNRAPWLVNEPLADFLAIGGIVVTDAQGIPVPIEQLGTFTAATSGEAVRGREAQIRLQGGPSAAVLISAIPLESTMLAAAMTRAEEDEWLALVVIEDVTVLKAAEQLKDEFIAVAAHELRNPMGAVKGYAQLLKWQSRRKPEHSLSSWQAETLSRIVEAADLLTGLTDDLLQVAKLQAGQVELDLRPHDPYVLARHVVERLQLGAGNHDIRVRATSSRVRVRVDARRTEQVLTNLVNNAIKYSPDGGPIDVAVGVDAPSGMAQIVVSDRGIGIPQAVQARIFGRFVRADNALERGIEGTGLGLFLCRALVELQGGQIWFKSVEGEGTTFFVTLPPRAQRAQIEIVGYIPRQFL